MFKKYLADTFLHV